MFTIAMSRWNPETRKTDNWTETLGVGTTLTTYMDDIQVMSDVWEYARHVKYWDEDSQSIKTCARAQNVVVDATPEVWAKVRAAVYESNFASATEKAQEAGAKIVKGSKVKVTSGRSHKGVEGFVAVVMQAPYRAGWRGNVENKLGIATSDVMIDVHKNGRVYKNYRDIVWVWARNCELAEVPALDYADIQEAAEYRTEYVMKNLGAK